MKVIRKGVWKGLWGGEGKMIVISKNRNVLKGKRSGGEEGRGKNL